MASKTWRGLRNGEALGAQAHGDVGLPQLAPQAFHGVGDDARVAESELGEAVHRQPAATPSNSRHFGGLDRPWCTGERVGMHRNRWPWSCCQSMTDFDVQRVR